MGELPTPGPPNAGGERGSELEVEDDAKSSCSNCTDERRCAQCRILEGQSGEVNASEATTDPDKPEFFDPTAHHVGSFNSRKGNLLCPNGQTRRRCYPGHPCYDCTPNLCGYGRPGCTPDTLCRFCLEDQ